MIFYKYISSYSLYFSGITNNVTENVKSDLAHLLCPETTEGMSTLFFVLDISSFFCFIAFSASSVPLLSFTISENIELIKNQKSKISNDFRSSIFKLCFRVHITSQ